LTVIKALAFILYSRRIFMKKLAKVIVAVLVMTVLFSVSKCFWRYATTYSDKWGKIVFSRCTTIYR